MASVMASRFSVLKIEDDSDQEREKAARKKAAEDEKAKKKTNKKKKKSKPAETADAELQSMAFGLPKPKQQPKQQKQQQQQQQQQPKASSESPRKDSESELSGWERRDQALIDEAFERDLQQAMLMSRVDYERAATVTPPEEGANGHHEAAAAPKSRAKKTKANVLSIDQLQSLSNSQIDRGDFRSIQPPPPSRPEAAAAAGGDGGDFFDQVEKKAKAAVTREKILDSIRQDLPPSAVQPAAAVSPELQLRLATAESRVEELSTELERTRDELKLAKARTKRVLSVLTQSETKEKVQLIVGLEKAQAARDAADKERAEMSAQVTSLLAQLEQERSKVHVLTTQLKRAQGNKRRGQSENDAADAVD